MDRVTRRVALVVEDDPALQEPMRKRLLEMRFDVVSALDYQSAVKRLQPSETGKPSKPDIVLVLRRVAQNFEDHVGGAFKANDADLISVRLLDDSAGIAVYGDDKQFTIRRAQGKLRNLEDAIRLSPIDGSFGIGQSAMEHGHQVAEDAAHARHGLGGEADLGHEDDGAASSRDLVA